MTNNLKLVWPDEAQRLLGDLIESHAYDSLHYWCTKHEYDELDTYEKLITCIYKAINDYWRNFGAAPTLIEVNIKRFHLMAEYSKVIEEALHITSRSDYDRSYFINGVTIRPTDNLGITAFGPV